MKTYPIRYDVTTQGIAEVQADSEEAAKEAFHDQFHDGDYYILAVDEVADINR
jgi:hypothetical protein